MRWKKPERMMDELSFSTATLMSEDRHEPAAPQSGLPPAEGAQPRTCSWMLLPTLEMLTVCGCPLARLRWSTSMVNGSFRLPKS